MSRPLRIQFPGALYHLTARGVKKSDIFINDEDRLDFLKILSEVKERFNWVLYSYCLMSNHWHLVVETPKGNLSRGIQRLNSRYASRFNRRNNLVGHVFQGRFKSVLVERESYFLELVRYVERNPVRAGLVQNAAEWPWSSYRAQAGLIQSPEWLEIHAILKMLDRNPKKAMKAYVEFVNRGKAGDEMMKSKLQSRHVLGTEKWKQAVKLQASQRENHGEIPKGQLLFDRPNLADLFSSALTSEELREIAVDAYNQHGYSLREIAECVGVHYSTLSRWAKK